MNIITIRVDTNREAFADRLSEELQAVLNAPQIINRLCDEREPKIDLFDCNGDICGTVTVTEGKL